MTDRRAAVRRRRKAAERAMSLFFFLCGMAAIAFVLGISLYLIISGLPAIREIGLRKFLTGPVWSPKQERFGILPFLLTSVAGTAGAVLLGVP
ncbi:MAG: phosphate ABC transporter permease subunit PstC, partial [Oscillibacter sp.]|nr:phosphate ABC transporter permease subunit PstC [Oscillibacter sp.]